MRTRLVGVILASVFLLIPNTVRAESACSYSEQAKFNDIASNVKATYDVVDIYLGKGIDVDEEGAPEVDINVKGLKVNILNVTEDIYINLINNSTKEEKKYTYSDTNNGLITFELRDVSSVVNYTIEIYAATSTCAGELIRKTEFLTPQYNEYSELDVCGEYPDFYYCQEFLLGDNISREAFMERIEEYKKNNEPKEQTKVDKNIWDSIKEFYQKHQMPINIIGSVIIIGGVIGVVILVKKRRSRVL